MFIDSHVSVGATLGVVLFKETLVRNNSWNDLTATLIAFAIGAFVGFLPDIDFLNKKLKSNLYYLENHRKWTHSILVHIPLSILFSFILFKFHFIGSNNFWFCSLGFFIILFSHLVLDLFTSWGVYLFYPFKKVVATKSISIIDFFFSLTMIIQLFFLFKIANPYLVYVPICIAFTYLLLTYCLSFYIQKVFAKALEVQGVLSYETEIKPTFGNAILWTVNVRAKDGSYLIGYYSIFQKTKEIKFVHIKVNEDLVDYNDAELLVVVSKLKNILNHWYSFSLINNQLVVNDIRYGLKTTDLNEKEFSQSFLIKKQHGTYDVYRKFKFKKGWFIKLVIRFFKV
ncbi:metal-dependent hydrolase [Wenyingzhuangia aestuarii]|uniref:metal-dependent hydrolase n=1 Tax=Wenyingzhuangia aestuarii TaxID=1647582 RepID=UPI0014391DFE|nr:metal-dependent hydrolase [Wenyingzhuangia aestuarii]NJB82490.1 inner membrane protein [Wenyingzhuangia aestuarii]